MKSPVKMNWIPFIVFTVGGIGLALFVAALSHDHYRITSSIALVMLFALSGFFVGVVTSTELRWQVNNPIDLKSLVVGQIYWLNGETWAKYVGQNEYTGMYGFNIYGIGDFNNPKNARYYLPGIVRIYISSVQEVFTKEK